MKKPIYEYKDGCATCIAEDSMGRKFIGKAYCAKEDEDFQNELTGLTIAEMRAKIEAVKTYRNDLKIKLSALNQLLYSMNQSQYFDPKSYQAKMLYRQIKSLKFDLDIAKHQLASSKLDLYEFIRDKEEMYQRIRKKRERDANMSINE